MADAAVEFLLNNLKDLLRYHSHLITDTKSQIENLERNLRVFNGFLKDSVKKRRKDERTQALVRNIRDVVYEVEDIIDAFVTQATGIRAQNYFIRAFKSPVNLHSIGKKVEEVTKQVEQNKIDFASLTVADEDKYEKTETRPPARPKDVVGFVEVREDLKKRLTKETDYLDVISLTGMFGLGKTTVAWNVFNDTEILHAFPKRIWLSISEEFSNKNIFLAILKEFTDLTKDLREREDEELARMAADYLENTKFLIVMDDVWYTTDWDRLKRALPENKMGKVLITSREEDVGKYASSQRDIHKLRFFDQNESWELFRMEALGKLECPPDLEDVGHIIAKGCKGLPLAIVVIGGILATKFSASNISATRKAWEKVSTRVSEHFSEDRGDRMKKFISLSYDKLPYHLRACFLYLGMFPEDYEIPASKLICMWIGEGFVQQNSAYSSLEETAEKYLEELINRNLVRIEKMKPDGKVKTCRIHDSLRDFCRTEAGNEKENFLQEIKSNGGVFTPPIAELHNYRRLSIHSNCLNFISSRPFGHRVRSFVYFSKVEFPLPQAYSSAIPAAFKLLRVLDVKPIRFTKIHNDMYHLIHLRYIVLSFNLSILSPNFSQLWNIQTLVVDTTSRTLEVKADLWKMNQLRHFKTNASAILPKPSKSSKHGAELQTLGTISVDSCTTELFERTGNLKKLGIRGRLALLLEGKVGSFDSLGKLRNLERLKLINDVYSSPASDGQLHGLPQPYQFPSKLRTLTLSATSLSWNCMSNLGLLENLEVLKLKDEAFVGRTWEAADGGFRRLEFLHIEKTDLVVWKASSHHFPRLRGLVLRNCEELLGIPIEMANIPSLQMLELHICNSAAASARNIQEVKKKEHTPGGTVFNISIFPPNG